MTAAIVWLASPRLSKWTAEFFHSWKSKSVARSQIFADSDLDDARFGGAMLCAASEPEALLKVLGNPAYRFKRIGLEAPTSMRAPQNAQVR